MIREVVEKAPEDVEPLVQLSDTPPAEAVENILGAEENNVSPDTYKELKPVLLAKNEAARYPATAPKAVADVMSESRQHAAVVKQDLTRLNDFEKQVRLSIDAVKGTEYGRQINELQFKRSKGISLTIDEDVQLSKYRTRLSELTTAEDYDYNFGQSVPAQVAGAVYGFGKGIIDNFGIVAAGSGAGAVGLGGIGAVIGGPPGALIGAKIGAIKGAVLGSGVAIVADTYKQSVGGIYGELSELTEGEVPLAESEKRAIAKGGGTLMAGLGLLPVGVLAKKVPWINKIVNPKAFVSTMRGPLKSSWFKLAKDLSVSGLAEAIEEGSQEAIQIITTEIGKTWDGKETSYIDAFSRAASNWRENTERIAKAATVGAVAGPVIQGGLRVAGPVVDKIVGDKTIPTKVKPTPKEPTPSIVTDIVNSDSNLPTNLKGTRAIQLKIAMDQASQITKDTETNKALPKKMDQIRQDIFDDAGLSHVYVDKEDLNAFANNEERAAKVNEMLSEMNLLESDLNAPVRIDSYRYLRLIDDYAELSDHAKDAPESMTAAQYVKRLEEEDKKRSEALADAPNPDTGITAEINQAESQQFTPIDQDIHNEPSYLEQPTFTEAMNEVLPKAEIFKVNEAQLTARVAVADAIKAEAAKEMNAVINLELEAGLQLEREQAEIDLEVDSKIDMVESFINDKRVGELSDNQKALAKSKRPINSIDPETLPIELKNRFIDDGALKARKVFSKNGMHINDVVLAMGAKSPTELLETLSSTPTRAQSVANAVEGTRAANESEAIANADFEKSLIAQAYDNMTKIHLKEMKILLQSNWAALKTGVKRIANPLPRLLQLKARAKTLVGSSQVKSLNANQWKVGERRSQKLAVNAILDNRVEEAFRQKENAALNTQLARETHIAIGKINRELRWVSRLNSRRMQSSLKSAGKTYTQAIGDLLELFNFNPRTSQVDIDNYNKFVKRMIEQGRGDFSIPQDVMKWLTTRKSAKDLTVDQLLYLTNKMRSVVHQAALKNRLVREYLQAEDEMTVEEFEDFFQELAVEDKRYDTSRSTEPLNPTIGHKVVSILERTEASMKNIQAIIQNYDLGKLNGPHAQQLYQPLDGTGLFSQQPYGRRAKVERQARLKKRWTKAVEKFGRKDFLKMGVTKVNAPEFKGTSVFNKSEVYESDLFMMATHIGNAENLKRLENFGISIDTVLKVIERELKPRHLDFIQEMVWGTFENYRPDISKLEKDTTGIDIEFTVPQSFAMFGKEYRGGYMPIKYRNEINDANLQAKIKALSDMADPNSKSFGFVPPSSAFEGIVYSAHTKERVGSEWYLDLEMDTLSRGFEEVIHDLTMRVPVADVMKLLSNKSISESLIATGGRAQYNALVNLVAKQTHAAPSQVLFKEINGLLGKTITTINSGMAINFLAGNIGTIFMNTLAIPQVTAKVGVKNAAKYLPNVFLKLPFYWAEMRELAASIDPTIFTYREGIDDFSSRTLAQNLPKKRALAIPGYNFLKTTQERAVDLAMSGVLGGIDSALKTGVVVAGYEMYMRGDAPGHSYESVMAMTEEERELNARAFAAQLSHSTTMAAQELDKAGIQMTMFGPVIAMFWNEARNQINNRLEDFKSVKRNTDEAVRKAKAGDWVGANEELQTQADTVLRLALVAIVSRAMVDAIRGIGDDEEDEDLTLAETVDNFFTPERLLTFAGDMGANSVPIIRDLLFSVETGMPPSFPIMKFLGDIVKTGRIGMTAYANLEDEIALIETFKDLSDSEMKSVLNVTGVMVGGLPVSGGMKLWNMAKNALELETNEFNGTAVLDALLGALNGFIERNDQVPKTEEEFEAIRKRVRGETSSLQQAVDQAKELVAALTPPTSDEPLTDEEYEILKFTESGGRWRAKAPKSKAFGLYQFIPSTWKAIMDTPEGKAAGLTEEGMYSRDSEQQETAMRIFTKMNAKKLKQLGVPVNIETLYFAHHFQPESAPKVYGVPDKTKIKEIVTEKVLKANPKLRKLKVDTAGEMKDYIAGQLERGKTLYDGHQLTTGL